MLYEVITGLTRNGSVSKPKKALYIVVRRRLGVAIQEIDQSLADSFGLARPSGALVSSVDKDGPAARAGLEAGDVILGIDGQPVEISGELPAIVAAKRPGETIRLQVWRNKATREITVKVGAFKEEKRNNFV